MRTLRLSCFHYTKLTHRGTLAGSIMAKNGKNGIMSAGKALQSRPDLQRYLTGTITRKDMTEMTKLTMMAALAAALFCVTGCSKESEYEKCMRESTKSLPELVSKPMIESAMEKFRAMNPDEQKKALEEIKAKLAK